MKTVGLKSSAFSWKIHTRIYGKVISKIFFGFLMSQNILERLFVPCANIIILL